MVEWIFFWPFCLLVFLLRIIFVFNFTIGDKSRLSVDKNSSARHVFYQGYSFDASWQ